MSLVLYVNGLSTRMAHSRRKDATCEGEGTSSFFRDPVYPTPSSEKRMESSAPRLLAAHRFAHAATHADPTKRL